MNIIKKILSFLIVFTFIVSSLVFVSAEETTISVDPKEYGKTWGVVYGYALGHQDKIKGVKSDASSKQTSALSSVYNDLGINDSRFANFRIDFATSFKSNFTSSYNKGYKVDISDFLDKDEKVTGVSAGNAWAYIYGKYDSAKGDVDFSKTFDLDPVKNFDVSSVEKTNFTTAYTKAYTDAYIEATSEIASASEVESTRFNYVTDFAMSFGFSIGKYYGIEDFGNDKEFDSLGSYQKYTKEHNLITETELDKLINETITSSDINNAFEEGFTSGYYIGYTEKFGNLAKKNNNFFEIGTNGLKYTIQGQPHASLKELEIVEEIYTNMTIDIPSNSAYGNQYITVYEVPTTFRLTDRYLPVGTVFYVGGSSDYNGIKKNSIKLLNDWNISMSFTGSYRAGLYKKEGSKWVYQHTVADGNSLTLTIPAGEYTEGLYTIIVDDGFVELSDVYSSWASESLEVFMRRNLLEYNTATNRYYPEDNMTRGQFVNLLKNYLVDRGYPDASKEMKFTDVTSDSKYYSGVRYAYGNGYLNGVSETEFNVNGNLTYKQFEVILSRILGEDVSLSKYFEEMRYEGFYMSKGEKNMNNYIAKSEVIYILYSIWK